MSMILRVFLTTLTQRLRSLRGWLIPVLLPVLVLAVQLCLPAQEVMAPVQVGVALPEQGAEEFWELLEPRSGTVLTFLLAEEEEIDRNVAAGRWDCGLVLPENFAELLKTGETDKIFTLRIGEGSAVHYLVQETVSACMAELMMPHIAEDYLLDVGLGGEKPQDQLQELLADTTKVEVIMTTLDGGELDPLRIADSGVKKVLQWLICAVVLVWMLLSAADLGRWNQGAPVRRMGAMCSHTSLLLGRIAAEGALSGVPACVAMLVLGNGSAGCVAVVAYGVFLSGCAVLLARMKRVWQAFPILPPFAVVISLLVSSALVDVTGVMPVLRWWPDYLFVQICEGTYFAVVPLVVAGVVFVGISALLDKVKK